MTDPPLGSASHPQGPGSETVVYAAPDGRHYVAFFEGELGWQRWPAEKDGWERRTRASALDADFSRDLGPVLGQLALRLSGAPDA